MYVSSDDSEVWLHSSVRTVEVGEDLNVSSSSGDLWALFGHLGSM